MPRRPYPKFDFHPFAIIVNIAGRYYKLTVLQTLRGIGEEHFQVTARNKMFTLSTNRPIVERMEVKDGVYTWKLIEGELNSQAAFDAITACLEAHLRGKPNPGGLHRA